MKAPKGGGRLCHGPVRMATGGKLSDEEIDALIKSLAKKHGRKMAREPGLDEGAAWQEVLKEEGQAALKQNLLQRRTAAFQRRADARREAFYAEHGGTADLQLSAATVGHEGLNTGSGSSVDAMGIAESARLQGTVARGLEEAGVFQRLANWAGAADQGFEEKVVVEMARLNDGPEAPTGDAQALKAAEVLTAALREARELQNKEGAWISELPGYIARQSHDALRVAGGFWRELGELQAAPGGWRAMKDAAMDRAFAKWVQFTEPLLSERTFDDVDDRGAFMRAVWEGIVTGRHGVLQAAEEGSELGAAASSFGRTAPGPARRASAERVLHYRDARSWITYHRQFGARGPIVGTIMQQLDRAGRNIALMRRFGPTGRSAFEADVARMVKAARKGGTPGESARILSSKIQRQFDEVDGTANAPESLRLATVGRLVRVDQSLSKLGGMVLSAFSDVPIATQALARAGVPFLDSYSGILAGISRMDGKAGRQVADLLDVGASASASQMSSRFVASDGPLGWSGWAMRTFYKINGFEFWNDGLRRGVAQMLSAHLGNEAKVSWKGLAQGTRETLQRFSIGEADWDALRKGAQTLEGRTWLTFEALDQIPDAALREELGFKLRALVHDVLGNAVSEARARERAGLAKGTRPGTVLGEAVRLFTQFWSFPLSFVGRHLGPAASGFGGKSPAFLLAHLILGTSILGYASMQAKQLIKGRTMRPLTDEDGNIRGDTVLAAFLQGGGLGIYGDFLFGEYNRFGGSPIGTIGGPAVGEFEQVLKLLGNIRQGLDPTASAETRAEALGDARVGAVRQVVGNTPFVNLWWTRAALDYGLLWRMNEAVSPGWAERYERRVEDQTGSEFWLSPTEAVQ